ncbi:MAG: DUF4422 domain-containing protein [Eubacteriales bacterium]|nr:DUF4422 domain-containing protein [Eubacteriales bacterium]
MKVRIFIACHKECEVPEDPMYLPMHVGSVHKDVLPGFVRDDTGENISGKNPVYCELTGLYWAWKNLDASYLGLAHYRRYFTVKSRNYQKKYGKMASVLTGSEAERLLKRYKVLVPRKRRYFIESVYSHYAHTFDGRQLDLVREIMNESCPEYLASFDACMKARSAYIFNMYLMPKELSDAYCEWLFHILEKLEDRVDTAGMSDFERRYAGRVSERLFNVWLRRQVETGRIRREEIREIPYLYIGEINWKRKILSFLQAKFLHRKYEKSF